MFVIIKKKKKFIFHLTSDIFPWIFNAQLWAIYQTEATEKCYLGYNFRILAKRKVSVKMRKPRPFYKKVRKINDGGVYEQGRRYWGGGGGGGVTPGKLKNGKIRAN